MFKTKKYSKMSPKTHEKSLENKILLELKNIENDIFEIFKNSKNHTKPPKNKNKNKNFI